MTRRTLAKELTEELRRLPAAQLRAVRTYVYFLKTSEHIDVSQLYFWTQRWQRWERQADADKRARRVLGDGTLKGVLSALKQRRG